MSTRCQIGIYETAEQPLSKPTTLLYKHSDGYPEGTVPLLKPLMKDFAKYRGLDDSEYLGAWALYALMEETVAYYKAKYRKLKKDGTLDQYQGMYRKNGHSFLGFGICGNKDFHGDIEYFYRLDPSGLRVYKPGRANYDLNDPTDWPLLETHKP